MDQMRAGLTAEPEEGAEQEEEAVDLPDHPEVVKAVSAAAIVLSKMPKEPLIQALESAEDISSGLAFIAMGLTMGAAAKTQVDPERLFGDGSVGEMVLDKVSMLCQAMGIAVSREEYDDALEMLNSMGDHAATAQEQPPAEMQGQPAAPPQPTPPTPPMQPGVPPNG